MVRVVRVGSRVGLRVGPFQRHRAAPTRRLLLALHQLYSSTLLIVIIHPVQVVEQLHCVSRAHQFVARVTITARVITAQCNCLCPLPLAIYSTLD